MKSKLKLRFFSGSSLSRGCCRVEAIFTKILIFCQLTFKHILGSLRLTVFQERSQQPPEERAYDQHLSDNLDHLTSTTLSPTDTALPVFQRPHLLAPHPLPLIKKDTKNTGGGGWGGRLFFTICICPEI